ncbi:adenine phosphoribosyltransferase [soil metagenome]
MTNLDPKFLALIHDVPDYPKPGVMFKDISPLLGSPLFPELIQEMADLVRDVDCDAIAGIEARGFILGAAMAHELNVGFIPVRKKGKLPPPVYSQSYKLEYGEDTIEVKPGKGRVVVVDDVLATGGTLGAATEALTKAGYTVVDIAVLMDLRFLNQFRWQSLSAKSLIQL